VPVPDRLTPTFLSVLTSVCGAEVQVGAALVMVFQTGPGTPRGDFRLPLSKDHETMGRIAQFIARMRNAAGRT